MILQSNRLECMRGFEACTGLEELYLSHNGIWRIEVSLKARCTCALQVQINRYLAFAIASLGVFFTFAAAYPEGRPRLFLVPSALRSANCLSQHLIRRYTHT